MSTTRVRDGSRSPSTGNELVAATRRARTVVNREVARWLGTRDLAS